MGSGLDKGSRRVGSDDLDMDWDGGFLDKVFSSWNYGDLDMEMTKDGSQDKDVYWVDALESQLDKVWVGYLDKSLLGAGLDEGLDSDLQDKDLSWDNGLTLKGILGMRVSFLGSRRCCLLVGSDCWGVGCVCWGY